MHDVEREIIDRLRTAADRGARPEGLLFHATCEEIEGNPRGGDYDGVLWTAESPAIAQQYIPASGSSVIVARPMDYELADRVRPDPHSWWHQLARRMSGLECSEVETGPDGRLRSWKLPEGWPTYGDCLRHVEEVLGYAPQGHGGYEIRQALTAEGFEDRPAGWQVQGLLCVTLSEGLAFKDLRVADEGDLMELQYHDLEAFARAATEGYDGVVINDFAQADGYGNVGHVSYGLLPQGCRKAHWLRIPAVRRPLDGPEVTADVEAWLEGAGPATAPAP